MMVIYFLFGALFAIGYLVTVFNVSLRSNFDKEPTPGDEEFFGTTPHRMLTRFIKEGITEYFDALAFVFSLMISIILFAILGFIFGLLSPVLVPFGIISLIIYKIFKN